MVRSMWKLLFFLFVPVSHVNMVNSTERVSRNSEVVAFSYNGGTCSWKEEPKLSISTLKDMTEHISKDHFKIKVNPKRPQCCITKHKCFVIDKTRYFLNSDSHYEHCDDKLDCNFENLKPNTNYNVRCEIGLYLRNEFHVGAVQHISVTTLGDLPNIDIELNNGWCWQKGQDKIRWTAQVSDYYGNYQYQFQRKSIACKSNAPFEVIDSNKTHENSVRFTDETYPYSKVKLLVWAADGGAIGAKIICEFNNDNIGVPQNKINSIKCKETLGYSNNYHECDVKFEKNCTKENGYHLKMKYSFQKDGDRHPLVTDYVWVSSNKATATINYNKLDFYTNYTFTASIASKYKKVNRKLQKTHHFTTKPTVPGKIGTITNVSSSDTITLKFPTSLGGPKTGELEYIRVEVKSTIKPDWYSDDSTKYISPSDCPNGFCSKEFTGLASGKHYAFMIRVKNKGVEDLGPEEKKYDLVLRPGIPAVPVGLLQINAGNNEVVIQFRRRRNINMNLKYYKVNISSGTETETRTEFNQELQYYHDITIRNLDNNKEYNITLSFCSEDHCSSWSDVLRVWTKPVCSPAKPQVVYQVRLNTDKENIAVSVQHIEKPKNGSVCLLVKDGDQKYESDISIDQCSDAPPNKCSELYNIWICKVGMDNNNAIFHPPLVDKGYSFETFIIEYSGRYHAICKSGPSVPFYVYGINLGLLFPLILVFILLLSALLAIIYRRKLMVLTRRIRLPSTNTISLFRKERILLQPATDRQPPTAPEKSHVPLPSRRVPIDRLEEYLVNAIFSQDLESEFRLIPMSLPEFSFLQGSCDANKKKNRYRNNLPYDETRVILPVKGNEPYSDYINASYIDTVLRERAFIATQGPKRANLDTREDFYRMVWSTNASHIVMVANVIEEKKEKVAEYWPQRDHVTYGDYTISYNSNFPIIKKFEHKIRTLDILHERNYKQVKQYQFTGWPDHGKPVCCFTLSQLILDLFNDVKYTPPLIVHCSAGIGRTGTVLLILEALEQLTNLGYADILQALYYLRKGRPRLVELSQYKFAHELLLEVWTTSSKGSIIGDFIRGKMAFQQNVIMNEYRKLKSLPIIHNYGYASQPNYIALNRNPNILPPNSRMIFLQPSSSSTDQYIPAVRIKGLLKDDAYTVMEHPLPCNLNKAWQLVYEKKIHLWILLNTFSPDDSNFPDVTSQTRFGQRQNAKVTVTNSNACSIFNDYNAEVTLKADPHQQPVQCRVIQFLDWPYGNSLPSDVKNIFSIWQIVEDASHTGTVLISCGDGITSSGLFLTFCLTMQRLQLSNHVNVYNSSMLSLFNRSQFLVSQDQYSWVYKAVDICIQKYLPSMLYMPETQ